MSWRDTRWVRITNWQHAHGAAAYAIIGRLGYWGYRIEDGRKGSKTLIVDTCLGRENARKIYSAISGFVAEATDGKGRIYNDPYPWE